MVKVLDPIKRRETTIVTSYTVGKTDYHDYPEKRTRLVSTIGETKKTEKGIV